MRESLNLLALITALLLPVQAAAFEFIELDRGRGLQMFNNYCVACHGDDGRGSSVAREDINANLPILLAAGDATPERYFEQIYHGGGGMPQIHDELSERDIWNIVYAIPLIRQQQYSEWHPDKFNNWQNGSRKENNGSD